MVPVHLYRTSRPWSVALLAAFAAGGAVLTTGGLSTAFGGAAPPAVARTQDAGESTPHRLVAALAPPPSAAPAAPAAAASASAPDGWQIQVGAFLSPAAAAAQLRAAETLVPELAELAEAPQVRGDMTRARFGGIADETEARRLCGRIVEAGGRCFVVPPGGEVS